MDLMYSFVIIFATVLFNPVQSEVCNLNDTKCLLAGANKFYDDVVSGNKITKSSDPLYYDKIIGQIKCFKYQLTNISMTGLKNCEGINSVIRNTSKPGILLYRYDLRCPILVLKYNYEAKGNLGPIEIDGKGLATLTALNYVIIFTGQFEEFIEDGEPHLTMKYNRIDTDPRGQLTLEAESLKKDKKKAKEALEYINSQWGKLEKHLRCPTMTKLIDKFNERQDRYLRTLPVDEVFSA